MRVSFTDLSNDTQTQGVSFIRVRAPSGGRPCGNCNMLQSSPKFAGNSKVWEIYVFWRNLKWAWQNGSTAPPSPLVWQQLDVSITFRCPLETLPWLFPVFAARFCNVLCCVVLWNRWRCFLPLLVFCPLACVFFSYNALSSQGHRT